MYPVEKKMFEITQSRKTFFPSVRGSAESHQIQNGGFFSYILFQR